MPPQVPAFNDPFINTVRHDHIGDFFKTSWYVAHTILSDNSSHPSHKSRTLLNRKTYKVFRLKICRCFEKRRRNKMVICLGNEQCHLRSPSYTLVLGLVDVNQCWLREVILWRRNAGWIFDQLYHPIRELSKTSRWIIIETQYRLTRFSLI